MVLTFVLSQFFIVKLLTKPSLLRKNRFKIRFANCQVCWIFTFRKHVFWEKNLYLGVEGSLKWGRERRGGRGIFASLLLPRLRLQRRLETSTTECNRKTIKAPRKAKTANIAKIVKSVACGRSVLSCQSVIHLGLSSSNGWSRKVQNFKRTE